MASTKLMASSSTSRESDLRRKSNESSSSTRSHFQADNYLQNAPGGSSDLDMNEISVEGILGDVYVNESQENTLLNAEIKMLDEAGAIAPIRDADVVAAPRKKTVDEVWREIVEGKREESQRRRKMELKEEPMDQMMTLEDFLLKAGAVDAAALEVGMGNDVAEVKVEPPTERLSGGIFAFDSPLVVSPLQSGGSSGAYMGQFTPGMDGLDGVVGYGNPMEVIGRGGSLGRGKRRGTVIESLDKAAQKRQRRMIKNRESAARSRERKQAYQVELESMAVRLEEENERLLKEKAEWTKERYKELMEKVIPVTEKRRLRRLLRRTSSMDW